jgi:hypothetical protein
MTQLGIIKSEEGRLFVEVYEDFSEEEKKRLGTSKAVSGADRPKDLAPDAVPTAMKENVIDALEQLRSNIQIMANQVHQALKDHKPQQWSLEFSIGFKGKANPVPFILQGETNGALKVTATWKE